MHSIDLLEEALKLAKSAGFEVRQEWLQESAGGACRIGSKEVLFVDLSLTAEEQLMQVVNALRAVPQRLPIDSLSTELRSLLSSAS